MSTWEKYQEEQGGTEEGEFSPLGLALLKQFAAGFSATCLLITYAQPSRNKKHGFPAAALYRNKTHGFPATNLQKQNTWHSSYQQTDRNKTHGFPATSSRNSSFFFPKKVWLKSMENACLEAFGCPASAKFKGSGPQFLLFSQDRHHSEACPSASSQLSHSSSHP